jgi:hypothetical protein
MFDRFTALTYVLKLWKYEPVPGAQEPEHQHHASGASCAPGEESTPTGPPHSSQITARSVCLRPGPVCLRPGPVCLRPGPVYLRPGSVCLRPGPVCLKPGLSARDPDFPKPCLQGPCNGIAEIWHYFKFSLMKRMDSLYYYSLAFVLFIQETVNQSHSSHPQDALDEVFSPWG